METKFKEKGLHEELEQLVDKAIEMTDDQVKGALLVMRSPLIVPSGRVRNVFRVKNENGHIDEFVDIAEIQERLSWDPNAAYNGEVPMGLWRRVVEVEAMNRDLADIDMEKIMTVIASKAADIPIVVEDPISESDSEIQELHASVSRPANGFTAKDAPSDVRRKVVELRNQGLAFHEIEKQLGLRQVRGMTAHRIFNKLTSGK
jgi:hypothetical protein